jgi:glycosyltransferase involved in cell wall biosynthesis
VKYIETGLSSLEFSEALGNNYDSISSNQRSKSIVYVAYFGSQTNIDALQWYLDFVHPRVLGEASGYVLKVVGRGDLLNFQKYAGKHVELIGEVDDLTPYIKDACLGIAPALSGSGFRGKVNQYSIHGIPSVVSKIAYKGLSYRHGESIFVADNAAAFTEYCLTLLKNDGINDSMANKARLLCKQNYTWDVKWPMIARIYDLKGGC